jgi:hypothetical protein
VAHGLRRALAWAALGAKDVDDEDAIRRLAREISLYLAERPDAVDTADGILRWWLPQRGVDATPEALHRALALLEEDGVLERRELPDGRSVYGRPFHAHK